LLKLNLNGEEGSQNGYYDGWCGSGKERLRGLCCGLRRSDRGAAGIQPGGLITADAVSASVGDASIFRNGRQFAAWLGLTPSQSGSGGKTKLGRITRRGDDYLRTLLVQGARSVLAATLRKQRRESPEKLTRLQQWIVVLNGRIGYHKTLVAIANKHARQLWAVLAKGESYNPQAWQQA